jgi:hypothetical protein
MGSSASLLQDYRSVNCPLPSLAPCPCPQGFPQGCGWIERIIYSLEQIRHDAPGHREMIAQEALAANQQIEDVAVLLPVIQKLRLIVTAKSGQLGAGARFPHAAIMRVALGIEARSADHDTGF